MLIKRRRVLQALATLPIYGARASLAADQYPSKPITMIVAVSSGTSLDITARFFSDALSKRLNTPVVVENRPGAGGLLGYTVASKAPADGYTIMLTGIPMYLAPLLAESTPPFDPLRDFVGVARVARVPLALVVSANSPHRSLADLVQAMRSRPGETTYSSVGRGSSGQICAVLMNEATKTKARNISYKESTLAVTDVAADRVSFTCQGSAGVLSLIQAGKLRPLAVTGSKRWDVLPNVPTAIEAGIPGFDVSSQLDFMAPAHTPASVVQILSRELCAIAETPRFAEFCKREVFSVEVKDHKTVQDEMPREAARWKHVIGLLHA